MLVLRLAKERSYRAGNLGVIASIVFFLLNSSLVACDICGCYNPSQIAPVATAGPDLTTGPSVLWMRGPYLAVSEQFTHFGRLQLDGHEVPNPTDQHLESSITQIVVGYGFNERLSVQMNLPLIYRSFQRPEGLAIDHGTESGLGDISFLANYNVFHLEKGGSRSVAFDDPKSPRMQVTEPEFAFSLGVFSGIKLPTGSSDRLKEEFQEVEIPGAPESAIHGHDLTLGTGSWDGIFGGHTSVRWKNAFLESELNFTLRGDGEHQYHFANDLSWSGGPGYYFARTSRFLLGFEAVVSGEHKDVDRFRGKTAEDTGMTSVFVGPRLFAAFGKISAQLEGALPVSLDNTALQAVPDYRLRAAVSWHF